MKKLQSWLKSVPDMFVGVRQMIALAWEADHFSFFMLIATQCLQGLVPLGTAWPIKNLFDLLARGLHGDAGSSLLPTLFFFLAAQALITVLSQLLAPVNQYFRARQGRALSLSLRRSVYQKISSISGLTYFEDPSFHNSIQMASNNAQIAPLQALDVFITLIQGGITLLSFLGVLLLLSPLLTAIIALAVLPQLFAQFRLSKQRFYTILGISPKERIAFYYGQVLAWNTYAKEMRLFNLGEYFLRKFVSTTLEINTAQDKQQRRELRWQTVLSLLASLVSTGAFAFVVIQAFSGRLSLGDVALFSSAVASTQGALSGMIGALARMSDSLLFFSQYRGLLALKDPLAICAAPQPVPPLTSGITLCNVSFRYSDHHPWILRNVDLFLPAHQCLALVGLNGAGKTTLVKLFLRLYDPTEGQILWDGIDIREFDLQEFRQHMGAIFQDFSHYDLTAQENIGIGSVAQIENMALIQKAAQKAGIHERIEALPQGYQSVLSRWLIEENEGTDLSGGEWQKLALARMFMRNRDADMLILDEPTAALDALAEYEMYRHFKDLMNGRTCLLITHRFSSVRMADQIAVLEGGCVTEYGTHNELLARQGIYAELYGMQVKSYG